MRANTSEKLGFTLIELLVVVSIIAVLAAFIGAALHRSREWSNTSKDVSNLRQLGASIANYVADEQFFPGEPWATSIHPRYIQSLGVFKSPSDKRRSSEDPKLAPASYDLNANLWGLLPVQIVSPAECIMMAPLMANLEKRIFQSTVWAPGLPSPLTRSSNSLGDATAKELRETKLPVIFADLHVDSVPLDLFQSSLENSDDSQKIADVRWNK
jgi:prepilin-type N-terminal cleavage/methylation domain-containing protein